MNIEEKKVEQFSDEISKELKHYVYRLIDPRNGETFYVGKGVGNRVFAHVNASLGVKGEDDEVSQKMSKIHDIIRSGLKVIHVIHRHGIEKDAIFEVEAALIDAYSGLSNIAGGHGSRDRGPMHSQQIIDKYQLPEIDFNPTDKLVLININRMEGSGVEDIYRQTRFAWRISKSRAEKADYVLAVIRGVVVGAFTAEYWKAATKENFPDISFDEPSRHAFKGGKAPVDIWKLYVGERGKRISIDGLRHIQNPIRYWGI